MVTEYDPEGGPLAVTVSHNGITVVADTREQALEELVAEQDRIAAADVDA